MCFATLAMPNHLGEYLLFFRFILVFIFMKYSNVLQMPLLDERRSYKFTTWVKTG